MVRLAASARVRIILSGTPMPQGAVDLWSQLNVLWPRQELTGTRETFKARADNDFQSLIADIQPVFTRTSKEALGIPSYRVLEQDVPAGPLQMEIIDLIAQRFRRQLEDADSWRDKLATLRRARPLRLLQAASNPDLLNLSDGYFSIPPLGDTGGTLMQRLADYRQREIPAKFAAALDILRDQIARDERTVVWTSFVKNIDQFADLVRRELGIETFVVDGRVPVAVDDVSTIPANDPDGDVDVTREERIEQFLTSAGPSVLIANPAACGESVSLHSACTTAIYLDRTYDCARYLQSVDRIHRLGLPPDADVRIHILQTSVNGTASVDQLVEASLMGKRARMEQLLEGSELVNEQVPGEAEAAGGDDRDLEELLRYLLGQ
jgi:SNF2 family DNA or RNA helicase